MILRLSTQDSIPASWLLLLLLAPGRRIPPRIAIYPIKYDQHRFPRPGNPVGGLMARIIWSSSCAALRSSFDCSTILHPETGAQRPSGESLYRVHSAAMILCIARLKHQACHTPYVLLATRAFPRCLDSKGVCSVSPVRSTSCTYVLLRIGKLS